MTRDEEIDLSERKRAMGEQLREVEREMQEQARQLRERNPEASEALLNALVEMQQAEIGKSLQYAAELVRRGMAPYAASSEEAVSRSLRRLRSNLREARELGSRDNGRGSRDLGGALSEVERLRRDLEDAARRPADSGSPDGESRQAEAGRNDGQGPSADSNRGAAGAAALREAVVAAGATTAPWETVASGPISEDCLQATPKRSSGWSRLCGKARPKYRA